MDLAEEATKEATQILLDHWDQGLPIDPRRLARALGADVIERRLEPEISGFIEKRSGKQARIYVSKLEPDVRRKFTLAHELGHLIRNPDGDFEYVDFRVRKTPSRRSEDERFADAFAAALLMPETVIEQLIELGVGLKQMAREFQVSIEAMRTRLERLEMSHLVEGA